MKLRTVFFMGALLACTSLYAQTTENDWQDGIKAIKSLIKTNPEQATEKADNLIKGKNKKNVDLIVSVARTYLDAGKLTDADKYLAAAQKADRKNPKVSILEGDIALERKDPGKACQLYEQAIYFDKNCSEAYLKYADVYRSAHPGQAIDKLEELKSVDPQKASIVDKAEAQIYYSHNEFDKAAEAYSRFIETPAATDDDNVKYAFALFLNHQFDKSLQIAQRGLQKNSRSAVFNRLSMYNNTDLKHYDEAEKAAQAFFNASDSATFSYLDYKYFGFLLTAQKQYDKAIQAYKSALSKDSTQTALWKEISNGYEELEDYTNAISYFKKYYGTLNEEDKTPELIFGLGKLYYSMGSSLDAKTQTAQRKAAFESADSVFVIVGQKRPDSYIATMWQARSNSMLDPDVKEGLAKPYYEKVVEAILAKKDPQYNNVLVECYSYLGYYSLLKKQYAVSKGYWDKILAIDPSNAIAKKALAGIKL
jgi:tetratricopeptide (TPR) repeat protein